MFSTNYQLFTNVIYYTKLQLPNLPQLVPIFCCVFVIFRRFVKPNSIVYKIAFIFILLNIFSFQFSTFKLSIFTDNFITWKIAFLYQKSHSISFRILLSNSETNLKFSTSPKMKFTNSKTSTLVKPQKSFWNSLKNKMRFIKITISSFCIFLVVYSSIFRRNFSMDFVFRFRQRTFQF